VTGRGRMGGDGDRLKPKGRPIDVTVSPTACQCASTTGPTGRPTPSVHRGQWESNRGVKPKSVHLVSG
jgi:hypothetical protein